MKLLGLILCCALLTQTAAASDFTCFSYEDGQKYLTVEQRVTHWGNREIIIKNPNEKIYTIFGNGYIENAGSLEQEVIQFYTATGKLTIVQTPQFCGRAGCGDGPNLNAVAKLVLDGVESQYSCHEKN
ncbi:MAG: hypothetical protein ACXVCP_06900 [Bdellovibrio sp.]